MQTNFTQWQQNSAFLAPMLLKNTSSDAMARHVLYFRPFNQNTGYAINSNTVVISFIAILFLSGSPSYISLFVMPIYINAVKSMFGRWFPPNILQKLFKRIETKFNPSTSIISVIGMGRDTATFFSGAIRNVFRRPLAVTGLTMRSLGAFYFPTATARGFIQTQVIGIQNTPCPTLTLTQPSLSSATSRTNFQAPCISKYSPSTNVLSCQFGDMNIEFGRVFSNGKIIYRHIASYLGNVFRVGRSLEHFYRPAFSIA